jgi:valyl-tRNA synthetase
MEKAPFRDVYITTLIRDKQGRKMSKSLGNGIDPLEIVDEYGADALKFTLAFLTSQGQDVLLDKESFKLGSKFANKIWNASRYILMNLEGRELVFEPSLNDADRWIYERLGAAAAAVAEAMAAYRFNDAASTLYEYFWNDFCDWYLEATKLSTRAEDPTERDRAVTVLLDVLAESLALLHPFLPFVTEEIYGKLPNARGRLIVRAYPRADIRRDEVIAARFGMMKELVTMVRALRAEFGIAPEKKLRVRFKLDEGSDDGGFMARNAALAELLAAAEGVAPVGAKPEGALALAGRGFECYVYAKEAVDAAQLAARFRKDAEKERQFADKVEAKLANQGFVAAAPEEVVAKERQKLAEARARAEKLERYLADLA